MSYDEGIPHCAVLEAARKQAADALTALTAPGLCVGIIYSTVGGFAAR